MKLSRLVSLLVGLALVAGACSSDGDGNSAGVATTTVPTTASEEAIEQPSVELIAPTDTDRPFDLAGGAASSSEGVLEPGAPGGQLGDDVAQATFPWETIWARRTVDLGEFFLGIPAVDPRDRIPPIDAPRFEPIGAANWLGEREPGALVQFNDEVRFYPLSILTRHEIVNDRYGDVPVVITFCPLCNTAVSFDARVDGEALRFGVSGLLRKSDLVMWDESTTSLWQQITGEAVVGDFAGTQLELIPTSIVSYGDALADFPDALSLSRDSGFPIDYGSNPYVAYSSSETPFLFADEPDPRFPALSRVVGVNLDGTDKAYPFELIAEKGAVNDEIGEVPVAVLWGGDTADALDASAIADGQAIGSGLAFDRRVGDQVLTFSTAGDDLFTDSETGTTWTLLGVAVDGPLVGEQLETVQHRNEFWFAWASFFPEAAVYGAEGG